MKVYAPNYYEKFACISDRCTHSCCVGWEIRVDAAAYEKYKALNDDFGVRILSSINADDEGVYFSLTDSGRCPHLNECGLCDIISTLGEEYLSDVCARHPRFINEVNGRLEVGLGLSCEEAVRVVLSDNGHFSLKEIGESADLPEEKEFDATKDRDYLISLIEEEGLTLEETLTLIKSKYSVHTDFRTDKEWLGYLLSLEIFDEEWRDILGLSAQREACSSVLEYGEYLERFFSYMVYRHVSVAAGYENLRARIGFVMLALRTVVYLAEREERLDREKLFALIRRFSEEIEYSEDNTADLIFEFESVI